MADHTSATVPTVGAESTELVVVDKVVAQWGTTWVLTLSRPEQRNPLDKDTVRVLRDLAVAAEAEGVRAVIITGAGKAFSAGGDLRGYLDLYRDTEAFLAFQHDFYRLCDVLEQSSYVSIAMVNGACVAGGLEVALACDFIIVADDAKIGDGHVRFGQLPGAGGSQRLCRAIGLQKAKEMLLTGRLYSGVEAAEMGLAQEHVPAEELRTRCLEIAAEVGSHSALGIRQMKALIALSQEHLKHDSMAKECDLVHVYATTSHDAYEGIEAFLDKRRPKYLGR